MEKFPIGIFDSGYGGLTILKEVKQRLPEYDYLYLGDNARAPYGPRSFDTVYAYTLQAVRWFFSKGCRLVMLACNTASAKALRTIQQTDLQAIDPARRVLGVIRPTAETIGNYSKTGHIGIVGTSGTVISQSYLLETAKFFPQVIVHQEACPEWVNLVEKNQHQSTLANEPVSRHLQNLLHQDPAIDTLLLACTHYPLLLPKIKQFLPDHIQVIEQGPLVAQSLAAYLDRHPEIEEYCNKGHSMAFYTTGNPQEFDEHTATFFGSQIHAQKAFLG